MRGTECRRFAPAMAPVVSQLWKWIAGSGSTLGYGRRKAGSAKPMASILRKSLGAEAGAVIVVRHADIAAIPRHMDVLHRVEPGDAIEWHMRLDRPPVPLRFEIIDDRLDGAPVDLQPRKGPIERQRLVGAEDQQAQDALHPGRAALGIGRDHDVVWTRPESPPAIAVDQPRAVALLHALRTSKTTIYKAKGWVCPAL